MTEYTIPFYRKSSLNKKLKSLYLFFIVFLASLSLFFFFFFKESNSFIELFFGVFLLLISSLFLYLYITIDVLNKFYIEISDEYIKVVSPFKKEMAYWTDIYNVEVYTYNNNPMLSFLLTRDLNKKTRPSISNNLNALLGMPPTSFQISLNLFKDIDIEMIYTTIVNKLDTIPKNNNDMITEISNQIYEGSNNNLLKAIILSLIFTFTIGIIYGISLCFLESNYVIIPILGSFLIIAAFDKYYLEVSFSLPVRFLVGLICSLQVPISIISAVFIDLKLLLPHSKLSIILKMVISDIKNIFYNPLEYIVIIIIFIICFGMGLINGRASKKSKKKK
ncbi:MAG: hypothetical protein ACLSV2_05215 [Clostridium sp.]